MTVNTDPHRTADCVMRHRAARITHHASRLALPAFTLLELLMVIAIMGILAAIALPTLRGLKPNAKVAATRQLLDAIGRARQLAISQRTTVCMVFLDTNFCTGVASMAPADQAIVQPLLDKQLTGYAYVTLRSVGDQPGAPTPRYLSAWKTLPEGAFISPLKFQASPNRSPGWWQPAYLGLTLTNTAFGPILNVPTFSRTNSATVMKSLNGIPFPSADSPVTNSQVLLSYIAFDGMGQLVSGLSGQPELIPLSEGSVNFARDPNTKAALPRAAQAVERPPGNTLDNYSLIYIDRLTGHARVERRKVQ